MGRKRGERKRRGEEIYKGQLESERKRRRGDY